MSFPVGQASQDAFPRRVAETGPYPPRQGVNRFVGWAPWAARADLFRNQPQCMQT
jgi:hypothetical protein